MVQDQLRRETRAFRAFRRLNKWSVSVLSSGRITLASAASDKGERAGPRSPARHRAGRLAAEARPSYTGEMSDEAIIERMAKAMHDPDENHPWDDDLCNQVWPDYLSTDEYHSCKSIWLWHARHAFEAAKSI